MTWIKLALILTLTHFSTTLPLDPHPSPDRPYSPSFLPSPQDTYEPQHPSLALTLPDPQPNPVAFYVPEPETLLKAPSESLEPDFYRVPIPEQDLVAPKEQTKWNPDNNPDYYFEVPSVVTKQELPTQEFPKKYNKEVHDKDKPYNLRPKEVVVFEKIDGRRYQEKQNELEKKFENLAKKENQKVVKA